MLTGFDLQLEFAPTKSNPGGTTDLLSAISLYVKSKK